VTLWRLLEIKTLAAGSCVLAIALWQGGGQIPGAMTLVGAGAVGALCYGVSIVLAVKALRMLGAARESAYFATAPFVGALLSIVVFRDLPNLSELAGANGHDHRSGDFSPGEAWSSPCARGNIS
jgi:drug/metabolite transporter (DMT)-like permease